MFDKEFIFGVVVGLAGVWAYHHFVHPLPGAKKG